MCFSPDGRLLAAASFKSYKIFEADSDRAVPKVGSDGVFSNQIVF